MHQKLDDESVPKFEKGLNGSAAKYTTNKGILPEILLRDMRDAFTRSEDLLDLEMFDDATADPTLDLQNNLTDLVSEATNTGGLRLMTGRARTT